MLLALIAARRNGFSLRALVFTPFPWVAVELARTYITGFPWDLLGTTQIDNIPLSRIATVTGVYGISFEIALVNTAVAAAFLVPLRATQSFADSGAGCGHRSARRQTDSARSAPATDQGATLVQANIPILDSDAWTLDYLSRRSIHCRRSACRPQQNSPARPGLIIWPESPAPFFVTDLHVRSTLADVARATEFLHHRWVARASSMRANAIASRTSTTPRP